MSSMESHFPPGKVLLHSTPRTTRRNEPLSSSMEFTPAKDFSAKTSSFKRLSGSATRSVKPDQISSVLSKSRNEPFDFKIFVDIPLQQESSNPAPRGRSPSTPKRSRAELKDDNSLFDEISPIGSPKLIDNSLDFEPHTTPKRRRSNGGLLMRSSLNDLFGSQTQEEPVTMDSGLSKSVDFSKMSINRTESPPPRSTSASRDFTPPRTRSQSRACQSTPHAPRKAPRSQTSMSLPNFDELPKPRRLFDPVPLPPVSDAVDLTGVMGIVGFVSSFLTRNNERSVPLASLVQLISTVSINYRSPAAAETVLCNLAKAVPEWVTVEGRIFTFSPALKTFDVLSKLRDLKRQQLLHN